MKHLRIVAAVAGIAVCAVAIAAFFRLHTRGFAVVRIGKAVIPVELAQLPREIVAGLSGRSRLAQGSGMLFLFEQEVTPHFWMRDMRFGIDIVWIRGARVVGITPRIPYPPPHTPDSALSLFYPPVPVDKVLELPSGDAEGLGIQVGDEVVWQ